MSSEIRISPKDNVAVALRTLKAGDEHLGICLKDHIPEGHKFALCPISAGESIIKYGYIIGTAVRSIAAGEHVHIHNVKTALSGVENTSYENRCTFKPLNLSKRSFEGYERPDGSVGIRNEIWIIPTVGCVNDVCKALEEKAKAIAEEYGLDGIYHFSHPYGCSQLGGDLEDTQNIIASLCRNPNAAGVLLVGLGCENNEMEAQLEKIKDIDYKLHWMKCQDCEDEFTLGLELIKDLAKKASECKRKTLDASRLVIGLKCGGSDGLSGVTANAVVGRVSDMVVSLGGTVVLSEVPEMFGAEQTLFERCVSEEVFNKAQDMINDFKAYYISHDQPISENPSPGNVAGGITTLEDKSLGCVQKGGTAPINGVLGYGKTGLVKGVNLLCGPGNDLVSSTAMAASGAQMVLFTTGRGTPYGTCVPTVKISTNSALYNKKRSWIDFNAGSIAEGEEMDSAAERLLEYILAVACGDQTKAEKLGMRSVAIWKNGVTL